MVEKLTKISVNLSYVIKNNNIKKL
jgi:hypothetical protein